MLVRFIHLSDTHIAPDKHFANYGHQPYANLALLVNVINDLPFDYDFILHSGDVVEDGSAEAYRNALELLQQFRKPVYYLTGNHDNTALLQTEIARKEHPLPRNDYSFMHNGVQFLAFDSQGQPDPCGELQPTQLEVLRKHCTPDGPPLVIWLHHQPLKLDVRWLDEHIFTDNGGAMYLSNYRDFQEIVRPARERIRGVFYGHIHRAIQTVHDGILYSSAPSTFGQLKAWPPFDKAIRAPEEAAGYCLVTINESGTQVQQYTFPRPA